MTVLVIRTHKRFAVCRKARLHVAGKREADALVIELSLDGCRVSVAGGNGSPAPEETLTLAIAGADPLEARVRWRGDGTLGLRFVRPLHVPALDALIRLCRGEGDTEQVLRA